jgi:hypothetical protein
MVYTRSVDRDSITRFFFELAKSFLKIDHQYVDNTDSKLFSGAVNTDGQPCVRNICANLKKMPLSGGKLIDVKNLQSNIS